MSVETLELQIPVESLELGMHVVRLDRPWLETDFLVQGFIIQSTQELEKLRSQCDYVFIEGKMEDAAREPVKPKDKPAKRTNKKMADSGESVPERRRTSRKKVTYINEISAEKEFPEATRLFNGARGLAKDIMDGLRVGRALDMNHAREVVSDCVDSILRNSDTLKWLTQIKNRDEYTAEHSMNVCILSAGFARHLGLMEEEIKTVGLCGLLHDVGKSRISLDILNKPGKLTSEEFRIMQNHTSYGRDLLMSTSGADRITVDVAYLHHEREDTSGYPRGLDGGKISHFAKLVALADIYDAITSHRCYDSGRSSMSALDIIYKNKGIQFDDELASEFIKYIGVYPPGSIVEMANGEVGIIIRTNAKNKLRPKVMILLDEDKHKLETERIVDMMKIDFNSAGQAYKIAQELPSGSYNIELKEFVDQGLVLKTQNSL